jgi:RNA polymerase sigma factor (sigma-70 family)
MDPRQLIEDSVELIDRLVGRACRRVGVAAGDVADMASMVKLALMENDCAILRRYEGRSSLATYLTIVIQRLLADQRERTHGRWRPSPEAERLGNQAVLIEELVGRQRRSVEEAMAFVRSVDPSLTREEVVAIADRLPQRTPRPREVPLPAEEIEPIAASDRADRQTLDRELRELSLRAGALQRDAMTGWPADDRLLVRLRFESSLTIADISRLMAVPQRPLYRRLEALLGRLRTALVSAGIDPATAHEILDASARIGGEFGLEWKNDGTGRTKDAEETDGLEASP